MSITPRKQVKQRFIGNTTFAYSNILKRSAVLESSLERDYYRWRVFFLNKGEDFITQPEPIEHHFHGKPSRYTPDGALVVPDFAYKEEVKYFDVTLRAEFIEKIEYLTQLYMQRNEVFRVVTEKDIRVGHRADNIGQLFPCLHHPAPIEEFKSLTEGLENAGYTIAQMVHLASSKNLESIVVKRAIAHRLFTCDLTQEWKKLVLFF